MVNGLFDGELSLNSSDIKGGIKGNMSIHGGKFISNVELDFKGLLEPMRAVRFTQYIEGDPVGGVTVQVKPPSSHKFFIIEWLISIWKWTFSLFNLIYRRFLHPIFKVVKG